MRLGRTFAVVLVYGLLFSSPALIYLGFKGIRVTINDTPHRTVPWVPVGKVISRVGIPWGEGDLLDVEGEVLRPGEGHPAVLEINGRPATPRSRLLPGDLVVALRGRDIVEPSNNTVSRAPPPVQLEGNGAFLRMVSKGWAGAARISRGALSGKVLRVEFEGPYAPTVVHRFDYRIPAKIAVLTFDDGPHPLYTEQVLDLLSRQHVKGVFFVVGSQAEKYPELVRRIAREGHELGNHSYTHAMPVDASYEVAAGEVQQTTEIVRQLTGKEMRWFRPVGGYVDGLLLEAALDQGYSAVLWNIDTRDWAGVSADEIARRVTESNSPNALVILFHDGGGERGETVRALPQIIEELRKRGYVFYTLSELAYYLGLD